MKERGTVKWFDNAKGFGFIQRASGEDVFVHRNAITGSGYKSLEEGQAVEFNVTKGPKGWQAVDVARSRPRENPEKLMSYLGQSCALTVRMSRRLTRPKENSSNPGKVLLLRASRDQRTPLRKKENGDA